MLKCEGYKMFHGRATIAPKNPKFPARDEVGDWLYKPEYGCWYVNGHSYPADIVKDIVDYADEDFFELMEKVQAIDDLEITRENAKEVKRLVGLIMEQLVGARK